jgi:hypothetical protein
VGTGGWRDKPCRTGQPVPKGPTISKGPRLRSKRMARQIRADAECQADVGRPKRFHREGWIRMQTRFFNLPRAQLLRGHPSGCVNGSLEPKENQC